MAGILDQIQQRQTREENQGLVQAANSSNWANFFESTPPVEKLRAQANLDDLVAKAVERKQQLLAQTDEKAQRLYFGQKKFEAWQEQQPLRNQMLEAQLAATGATERRKALESATAHEQTAAFNDGVADIYRRKLRKGTPEFIEAGAKLIADNPFANPDDTVKMGKMFGFAGETPEELQAQAAAMVTAKEKARLAQQPAKPTLEEKVAEAKAISAGRAQGTASVKPPADLTALERERKIHQTSYDKASARRIQAGKADDKDLINAADADIMEARSALGDVESRLRAGRTDAPAAPASSSPTQFADEGAARASGAKPGDIVVLINPATGKPARARIN